MKTIRTFPNLIPAQLVQARLRAAGIDAIIPEESSVSAGYASAVGGVRVQVHASEAEAAERFLRELEEAPPGEPAG